MVGNVPNLNVKTLKARNKPKKEKSFRELSLFAKRDFAKIFPKLTYELRRLMDQKIYHSTWKTKDDFHISIKKQSDERLEYYM